MIQTIWTSDNSLPNSAFPLLKKSQGIVWYFHIYNLARTRKIGTTIEYPFTVGDRFDSRGYSTQHEAKWVGNFVLSHFFPNEITRLPHFPDWEFINKNTLSVEYHRSNIELTENSFALDVEYILSSQIAAKYKKLKKSISEISKT